MVGFGLGAVVLAGGLFIVVLMARSWWAEAQVYRWSERTATIVEAHAFESRRAVQDPSLSVRFRYDYGGRTYESDRVDARSLVRFRDAYRMAALWQPGSSWPCYVDPRNPEIAVLRRDSLWWGFAALLPLAFGLGLGGLFLYAAWASVRSKGDPTASSTQTGGAAKRVVGRLAITLFLAILALMTYLFSVRPLILFRDAAHWRGTPCTIVASGARALNRDSGTGYRAEVVFRYQFDGRAQVSGDFELVENSNLSYRQAAAIVGRYPPGASALCYVNPRDPARAVLDRSFPRVVLFGLIPFAFLMLSCWGLVAGARRKGRGA